MNKEKASFKEIWRTFSKLKSEKAIETIWNLTYSKESAKEALDMLGVKNLEDWDGRKEKDLAKNLEKNYKSTYPDYCKKEIPPELQYSFKSLSNGIGSEAIAYVIYSHCWPCVLAGQPFSNRTLFLLSSKSPDKYIEGLRSMDFAQKEIVYLVSFHQHIAEMFKDICFLYENEQ